PLLNDHTLVPVFMYCTLISPPGVSMLVLEARQIGQGRIYPLSWQEYEGGVLLGYLTTGGPQPCMHSKSVGQLVSFAPLHCLPIGLVQIFLCHKFPGVQSESAAQRL